MKICLPLLFVAVVSSEAVGSTDLERHQLQENDRTLEKKTKVYSKAMIPKDDHQRYLDHGDGDEWFCPKLYHKGVLELEINPAFLNIDEYNTTEDGGKSEGLIISSFFNTNFMEVGGMYVPIFPPFAPDQVGRIQDIDEVEPDLFDFATDYERLTDATPGPPITTWPNDARRVPDGVLPFEGVIIPQGFHPIPTPGRLTIIDVATLQEYLVHESPFDPAPSGGIANEELPRFFHKVLFHDMDDDGLPDIVTVRSGLRIVPYPHPPYSELVYYKNPGDAINPTTEWQEVILYGGASVDFMGPDIHLAMHDFEKDGVPEIVATHFFTGDEPTKGKIVMYGAPPGRRWRDVDAASISGVPPRVKLVNDSQGLPFSIDIVDLNGDGKMEILATNHQPNCVPGIQGQVYALEQPESGDLFNDEWTVRVLLDGILPQPTPAGSRAMRLAPGHAIPFYPKEKPGRRFRAPRNHRQQQRPWILVSGDEAGKVWMMKPLHKHCFDYETAVVFDINDYYGEGTTQVFTPEHGVTVSTIGEPAFHYDGDKNVAEIYIPVFEAQNIHVLSFYRDDGESRIHCPADITYECQ